MSATFIPSIYKNGGTFIGSLLFAFILWILFYFSKDFKRNLIIPVQIISGLKLVNNKPYSIYPVLVKVHGRGWLINQFAEMDHDPIALNAEFSLKGVLQLKPYLTILNQQMPKGVQIEEILTENLHVKNDQPFKKKVPLIFNYKINFQPQYNFSKKPHYYPDSVELIGSQSFIKDIKVWKVPTLFFNAMSTSLDTSIKLSNKTYPEIKVAPDKAEFFINIDRYTESQIRIPIKVIHSDTAKSLNLLPSEVTLTFLVPLSYYSTIHEDLFEAEVDLEDWKKRPNLKALKISITRFPDIIKITKIQPEEVDFVIYP